MLPARGSHEKSDRIRGVVRDGKSVDGHVANGEGIAGDEKMGVDLNLQLGFDGFAGQAIAINGHLQFCGQAGQAGDVVGMLVGDENAVNAFRGAGDGGEALANLASAETGVNQKAGFRRFQIGAIASRTAAQNCQLNRHGQTLEGAAAAGNLFLNLRIPS